MYPVWTCRERRHRFEVLLIAKLKLSARLNSVHFVLFLLGQGEDVAPKGGDEGDQVLETKLLIAHAREGRDGLEPHPLEDHLRKVAYLSSCFAAEFDGGDWGFLAGLWHDLGKYRPAFQKRIGALTGFDPEAHIEGAPGKVTHSTAGAVHAIKHLGEYGRVIAYLIAGHHAGLPDWNPDDGGQGSLQARLESADSEYTEALAQPIPDDILNPPASLPKFPSMKQEEFALWIRMLFSCLVDADFLDTEFFMDAEKSASRNQLITLEEVKEKFDLFMEDIGRKAKSTSVNAIRADILAQCRQAAFEQPGIFSLTVPTGGGKTLSSLAFALDHAVKHGKKRIIYAIPYTSIIEQTAQVFKGILGDDNVLEHHSNLDVDPAKENHRNRLAAENWDAPLIVTTNVQFFESLFAARTSRCRKLHNIVNSVVILDEAQLLPREFLKPILTVMRQLTTQFGVTFVLCTATQPALTRRVDAFGREVMPGLENVREIIVDPAALYECLQRVQVYLPKDLHKPSEWVDIAAELMGYEDILAIVNTRKECRELFQLMPQDGTTIHLSALMCGEHRSIAINQIKQLLKDKREGKYSKPIRVISTQLVEAGVDFDFPVVYRALAGLDSIAQAAGRCNREGLLPEMGRVHVFVPPKAAPRGLLLQGQQTARELLTTDCREAPLAPETFKRYFSHLYNKGDLDANGIQELLKPERGAFRTAAEKFRLIEDAGEAVIVRYVPPGKSESPVDQWLAMLAQDTNQRWIYRKLQRYTVNVPKSLFDQMQRQGDIETVENLFVMHEARYDQTYGLLLPEEHSDPTYYVC